MGNIPVYKEIPINDSLLRNTDSLYQAIIEGSNRIVNNISSINTEMRIFGNFDNYLQIRPKIKGETINSSKSVIDFVNDYNKDYNVRKRNTNDNSIMMLINTVEKIDKIKEDITKLEDEIKDIQKEIDSNSASIFDYVESNFSEMLNPMMNNTRAVKKNLRHKLSLKVQEKQDIIYHKKKEIVALDNLIGNLNDELKNTYDKGIIDLLVEVERDAKQYDDYQSKV